jgi:hypothetical protein
MADQTPIQPSGKPWPQTETPTGDLKFRYPNYKTRGFLPPLLISPTPDFEKSETDDSEGNPPNRIGKVFGQYVYTDWRGQFLNLYEGTGLGVGDMRDKFEVSKSLPKGKADLVSKPYSTRDNYLIFNDTSQDYFRHGLQILDGINTTPATEFWDTQKSRETATGTKLSSFSNTPFENSDPVIFGFDIIFDDVSSPLLNGSINDFLALYSRYVSELNARIPVYEEFKQQFVKFFKTRATVRIDELQTSMTALRPSGYAETQNTTNLFSGGRKAYMNYYLKKITGLSKLIEGNTAETKSFITDYNKDVITLTFTEDVSLSVGTLAHLYKLLYWSRPNGKTMIPENLLRFNCEIIISEVRNFNRVRKSLETGEIQVVKDNVSRYVYSLRECQFYFNTMPHDDSVDLSSIKVFDTYDIQFDYKYATTKFEKFVPVFPGGVGTYVGYNNGAMWKIGNAGARDAYGTGDVGGTVSRYGKATPAFYTVGENKFNHNGVTTPIIMSLPGVLPGGTDVVYEPLEGQDFQSGDVASNSEIENLQKNSKQKKSMSDLALENSALYDNDSSTFPTTIAGDDITSQLFNRELTDIRSTPTVSNDEQKKLLDAELAITRVRPIVGNFEQKKLLDAEYDETIKSRDTGPITRFGDAGTVQNLYGDENKIRTTSVEEALRKQRQGVKLGTTLRNSLKKELQTAVNTRVGLLNKSLNKILSAVGVTGVSPPKNIYTGADSAGGRIFRDIRGQLKSFLGNSAGNLLQ